MKAKSSALLDIEKIFQASEDSQMSSQFLTKNAKPLERLANRLEISREQATLFAIVACSSYIAKKRTSQQTGRGLDFNMSEKTFTFALEKQRLLWTNSSNASGLPTCKLIVLIYLTKQKLNIVGRHQALGQKR